VGVPLGCFAAFWGPHSDPAERIDVCHNSDSVRKSGRNCGR